MSNEVVRRADGTIVGHWHDGWIEKHVNPARHKLRSPSGWATDKAHIVDLVITNGKGIRLRLPDGVVLEATLANIIDHGIRVDRGHGQQLVLVDKWWKNAGDQAAEAQLVML